MEKFQLIDLQEHCFRLSILLGQLDQFDFLSASDWLTIASGIESVKVNTSKFDYDIMYCGSAYDYEEKRSELLSQLSTRLTIFNFVWGSFESTAKSFSLPALPKYLKRGSGSIVDRSIWYLKQHYGLKPHIAFYDDTLYLLRQLLEVNEFYSNYCKEIKLHNFADVSGLGLHIVRKIRNELAHGSAVMPLPDDWGEDAKKVLESEYRHLNLIDAGTRITLFTIQMLLLAIVGENNVNVRCLSNAEGEKIESSVQLALCQIHLELDEINLDQLLLFPNLNFTIV